MKETQLERLIRLYEEKYNYDEEKLHTDPDKFLAEYNYYSFIGLDSLPSRFPEDEIRNLIYVVDLASNSKLEPYNPILLKAVENKLKYIETTLRGDFGEYRLTQKQGSYHSQLTKYHKALDKEESINIEELKSFIETYGVLDFKDEHGKTLLHYAATNGYTDIARMLIENDADINIIDQNKKTALHIAIEKGNNNMVQMLIENGANINFKYKKEAFYESDGNTPLDVALENNNIQAAKMLIENGAELDSDDLDKIFSDKSNNVLQESVISRGTRLYPHRGLVHGVTENINNIVKAMREANTDPEVISINLDNIEVIRHKLSHDKNIVKELNILEKELKQSLKIIEKFEAKFEERFKKAVKQLAEGKSYDEVLGESKLYKHMSNSKEIQKAIEEEGEKIKNKLSETEHLKLSAKEKLKSIFYGTDKVKMDKVLKDVKPVKPEDEDSKMLKEAKLKAKFEKHKPKGKR